MKAKTLLLRNARAVLTEGLREGVNLLVEGGRIARIMPSNEAKVDEVEVDETKVDEVMDLSGLTLYPGFIDLHIHGAVGVDTMEAEAEDLRRVARFLSRHGVTGWLPTLVPAPDEDYARAVSAIEELMDESDDAAPCAQALGVHYEGPFVNAKQCGALRTPYFRTYATPADVESLPRIKADGALHMTTLAPEIEGGIELISALTARGWLVSIGHTRADAATLDRAREAGARHMTHFLNAMSPLHHRAPGPVGWGLVADDVSVDIIADGVHSDPLMLRLVVRAKGNQRVSLISDAVAPAGQGDGRYTVWGETITVQDGRTSNERGSIAGSVIMLDDAVRMMLGQGFAPPAVARMASTNPARLLGLEQTRGSISEGKRADLAVLDAGGRVRLTLVAGRTAFTDWSG